MMASLKADNSAGPRFYRKELGAREANPESRIQNPEERRKSADLSQLVTICQIKFLGSPTSVLRFIPGHCGVRQVRLIPMDSRALPIFKIWWSFLLCHQKRTFYETIRDGAIEDRTEAPR